MRPLSPIQRATLQAMLNGRVVVSYSQLSFAGTDPATLPSLVKRGLVDRAAPLWREDASGYRISKAGRLAAFEVVRGET